MDGRFTQFLRSTGQPPTRREVTRGLAGVMAGAGLFATFGLSVDAKKHKKKKKKKQCTGKKPCEQPLNPCQVAICGNNKCKVRNADNGTVCGDGLVCQAGACACPGGVCMVSVSAGNLNSWHGIDACGCEDVNDSLLTFRTGPGVPPYGTGSVELTAPDNSTVGLGTFQFASTLLSQITALKYSTYQPSSNLGAATAVGVMTFGIDFFGNNPPDLDRLVFDPAANGEPVAEDTWQEWDAIAGGTARWFYDGSSDWPNTEPPISATDSLTWQQIVATYPDARINFNAPLLQILLGADADPFTESINSVTFGTAFGTSRFVFG